MNRIRILLVDDEEPVLRACSRVLHEIPGAEIVLESVSQRAAEMLSSEKFDLLISDMRMPGVDGVELLRIAHRHHPQLPVILITGFPTPDVVADGREVGAAACVMKPVVPDELITTVRSVLSRDRATKSAEGDVLSVQ